MNTLSALGAPNDPYRKIRPLVWLLGLGLVCAMIWVMIGELRTNPYYLSADFIVFWVTARAPDPYDFHAITAAQHWYTSNPTIRPFAYPPSFLPWIEAFGLLPMLTAYWIWTVASCAAFFTSWARVVRVRYLLMSLAAPTFILGAVPGQVVFLLGAMIVLAVPLLDRRPLLAGLLLGVAATIKPQAVLLIPLALAAGGYWKALISAATTGAVVGLLCLATQGSAIWLEWLHSIPAFSKVLDETHVIEFGITPSSAMALAGVHDIPAAFIRAAAGLLGAGTVVLVFRKSDDPLLRILALNVGTLLALPYAMAYELVLAAPAAAKLIFDRKLHPAAAIAGVMVFTSGGKWLALVAMCSVLIAMIFKWKSFAAEEPAPSASIQPDRPALA